MKGHIMIKNLFLRMFPILLMALLGACASTPLPDDTLLRIDTVRTLDHAYSFAARWRDTGRKNAKGEPIWEEVRKEQVLGTGPDGKPIVFMAKSGETISGPSVAGQLAVAVVAGPGTAVVNGITARSVADKGQCKGTNANCGTVINVQSVAESLTNTNVNVGVAPACAATSTCGN